MRTQSNLTEVEKYQANVIRIILPYETIFAHHAMPPQIPHQLLTSLTNFPWANLFP